MNKRFKECCSDLGMKPSRRASGDQCPRPFLAGLALAAFAALVFPLFAGPATGGQEGVKIVEVDGRRVLRMDGEIVRIRGVCGTANLDLAAKIGANSFRTWGGNVERVGRNLELAEEHDLYLMQGIRLTKDRAAYTDNAYKDEVRALVRELAETYKNHPRIIAWGIGNEISLLNMANTEDAWRFVDELAVMLIKAFST